MKVAPRFGIVHCIGPAAKAREVARRRLGNLILILCPLAEDIAPV
jgi:hypothetical protein